jgi:hypothetical protein
MQVRAGTRLGSFALGVGLFVFVAACGSPTVPTPIQKVENFTGTLQPLGTDTKPFTVSYSQSTSDLSVTINSLTTVAGSTPVTGITIGVAFGAPSGTSCAIQVQAPAAPLGQELFAPNGASAGNYCVVIFDCPTGTTGCTSMLTEPVTYAMTVKHY